MKNTFTKIALATLFGFAIIFAQETPLLAVYAYGASDAGINRSFGNKLLATMVQSGKYAEIANTEAFYEDIEKNGNSQIAQSAKLHGADYVCIVSIAEAFGTYSFSARLVNISDSQVLKTATADRSLKSMDDLTIVSNELAIQFLPLPVLANAQAVTQKQCVVTFNINEILFKIKNSFQNQLKDCSSKFAKELALSKSPFGKKTAAPEPKAFMKQCAISWIKNEIADEFPSKDKLLGSVDNFMQSLDFDPNNLANTISNIKIDGLLGDIKKLVTGECVVDVQYDPPISAEPQVSEPVESNSYKNFTTGQRWGTWALNLTINGLGYGG